MTKYVACEDCVYQNICENFDPFMQCPDGESIEMTRKLPIILLESEDNKNELY